MLSRLLTRLIDAQGGWAKPFGDVVHGWLSALFRPLRFLKDLLNGKWLGHPLHAVITDVAIGSFTLVVVFDILDVRRGADIALWFGLLSFAGAVFAGFADYTDTDGRARMVATIHMTVMLLAGLVYLISGLLRLGDPIDRTIPVVLELVAYGFITVGGYLGGEVAYTLGNMVNRHAWRFWGDAKWQALDVTEVPEGVLTKAKAGAQSLVLVRTGDTIHALHDVCAHAGGSLSEGRLVNGCVECPLHQSRYEMKSGFRKAGPTTYDQPRYEVRAKDGGGFEALRVTSGSAGQVGP